jgi:uncharacterized protein with HEPN domain
LSQHDDLLYLVYIDEAGARIERTISAEDRPSLDSDVNLRDATLFRLQTLAESTQRLSGAFKNAHPEISWERVAGFRNRVVHGYLDVDLDIVWAIIEHDLPPLLGCIRTEIARRLNRDRSTLGREDPLDSGL